MGIKLQRTPYLHKIAVVAVVLIALVCVRAVPNVYAQTGTAPTTISFRCNYDIVLEIDGETYEVRHQDSVRNGSHIPLGLGRFSIELTLNQISEHSVQVTVMIFETMRNNGGRVLRASPDFNARFGHPTNVVWSEGMVRLDIAASVSIL